MHFNFEQKKESLNIEQKESVPKVETVRAALFHNGTFLVLQKDNDSKNPNALEFPGGKIDDIEGKESTIEEQKKAVILEVEQETGIDIKDLPLESIENYEVYFETVQNEIKKKYKRIVHLFLARLPDEKEISPVINTTMNELGKPEDKHKDFKWLSPEELIISAIKLDNYNETDEKFRILSRNSRYIKKLLQSVGYLENIKEN